MTITKNERLHLQKNSTQSFDRHEMKAYDILLETALKVVIITKIKITSFCRETAAEVVAIIKMVFVILQGQSTDSCDHHKYEGLRHHCSADGGCRHLSHCPR